MHSEQECSQGCHDPSIDRLYIFIWVFILSHFNFDDFFCNYELFMPGYRCLKRTNKNAFMTILKVF